MRTVPPCRSTIAETIASPRPDPPRLAVAGGVRSIEAPEDLLHILVGDSRTVVAHLDDGDFSTISLTFTF